MGVTLKEKLKGSFDLVFLFGRGIEPFEKDNSRAAGLKSLWVPVILFPMNCLSAWLWPSSDLKTLPKPQVLLTMAGETIADTILGILLLWAAVIALNCRDRFWIVFQAMNWVNIPFNIIGTPFLVLALMGWHDRDMMDRVFTVILYYQFIVYACIYFRGFKTNWMLGGAIACFGVQIGQFIQNCADWINGVPTQ